MGELRINGNTVAVFENGTVYAGGSAFWGKVIGYYGGGEIQNECRKTVAKYSAGTAYDLPSFGSVLSSGSALCFCSGSTIYEGGSSWNNMIGRFTGDIYGACAAATLYFSLYDSGMQKYKENVDGNSIGTVFSVILALILILGVIFVWPALFEVGGGLSVLMIGTQIVSHIIWGAVSLDKERCSFFNTLKPMCLSATLASGFVTWIFSGTKAPMLLVSFFIAFLASVGSSLIATIAVMMIQKKLLKEKEKEVKRIAELSKNYTPIAKTWRCRCGAENNSNYGTCKKCGEYRNTTETPTAGANRIFKSEERTQYNNQIIATEIAKAGAWTCTCGRVNMAYVSTCVCGCSKHKNTQTDTQKQ